LESAGPRKARRQVPPYSPTLSTVGTTSGFSGRRASTAGSLPAFTWSASAGASLYLPWARAAPERASTLVPAASAASARRRLKERIIERSSGVFLVLFPLLSSLERFRIEWNCLQFHSIRKARKGVSRCRRHIPSG